MVHTRHSRDVENSSPPAFLTMVDRKAGKTRPSDGDFDGHDTDQSGVYHRKRRSVFEEKTVDSRLRPRTGPRSYNYVFADSSDDEMTSRQCSRMLDEEDYGTPERKAHRQHIQSQQSSDEEDQKEQRGWHRIRSEKRCRTKNQRKEAIHHHDEDDDDDNEEHQDENEHDDDLNNSSVRRSSRLRRKPFRFRGSSTRLEETNIAEGNGDTRKKRHCGEPDNSSEEFEDMYSRVKRPRIKKIDEERQGENSASASEGSHDEKNESGDETQQRRSYSLREHKPRTQLYIAPAIEGKKRTKNPAFFHADSPPRRRVTKQAAYCSPAHRRHNTRKRQAFHGSSSSTSSDSDSDSGTETSDEQRFSRRKAKSMAKARARICPLNFTPEMIASSHVMKDRVRTGASLADVDPMEIDKSVTFDSVGGLQEHIMRLKEMVVFPLLYPEFYERFKVAPSRGVLFYGPPGTGKTLVARALANECSRGDHKVAFFMRKGADCLSKWVGEAERQLRLLFDKAYELRPSIIFFDEIDGLAPVRSSRQDQIHSSIVSTLLALMDGIDSRGEIVVIGATNRIDSIDPALRRPGRFDREFLFPLPSLQDRMKILKIHTKEWSPALRDDFMFELAEKCAGYCGADLKCLVTEATQNALRRRYPQIYTTSDKLQLDVASITLTALDFAQAITNIVPAAQRAVPNPAAALEATVRPLLTAALTRLEKALAARFPYSKVARRAMLAKDQQGGGSDSTNAVGLLLDLPVDEDDNAPSIFMPLSKGIKANNLQSSSSVSFLKFVSGTVNLPAVFRPRVLVSGAAGQGQSIHLAPAALHLMEHLPVHTLNSATLFAASAKLPEEACANVFHEAKRTAPSIIYIPYLSELWGVVSDCMRVTFLTMVRSISPSTPILMLATSEVTYIELDDQLKSLFSVSGGEVVEVESPTKEERLKFFHDLIMCHTVHGPPTHKQAECLAANGLSPFFPQEMKKKETAVCKKAFKNKSEITIVTELSDPGQDHVPNPRSKQTKIGDPKSVKIALDVVKGSGGEGSVAFPSTSSHMKGRTDCMTSMRVKVDSSVLEASSSRKPVKSNTACTCQSLTKNTKRSPSKMTIETRACSLGVRRMSASMTSTPAEQLALPKQSRRKRTQYTAVKGRWKDSQNSNCSASSFLAHYFQSHAQLPRHLFKRYPSRRSPYNKKAASFEKSDVSHTWQFNVLPYFQHARALRVLEPLEKAPRPEPRKLSEKEQKILYDQEEDTLRELRIFLRDILGKLGREKKFAIFTKPVDIEEVPDYYDIIKEPMDLSTIMSKIDLHRYNTASAFLDDIFLICKNALEYNPDRGPMDRGIRHRACSLRDTAQALMKSELDPEFERICKEIEKSRLSRGVDSSQNVPAFYHTRPPEKYPTCSSEPAKDASLLPSEPLFPEGCRYSRRVRGLDADRILPLEVVEKNAHLEKSLLNKKPNESTEDKGKLGVAGRSIRGGDGQRLEEGSKKRESQKTANNSTVTDKHVGTASASADCICPSSSGNGSTSIHSGKISKGSSDSKHSVNKKASMIKKCPWLATRRRRRHHSSPSHHRQELSSPAHASDIELITEDESMEVEPSLSTNHVEGWVRSSLDRSRDEHSPVSAANPANVNVPNPARACSNTDNIPESQHPEGDSTEQLKQKGVSSLQEKISDNGKPRKSGVARCLDLELLSVTPDSGISSESNGDSRDSLDHSNSNPDNSTAAENHGHMEDANAPSTSTSGAFVRATRLRTQNPLQMSALAALEKENGQVIVDKGQLSSLLAKVVAKTAGFTVESLQHLYSVLSCTIYNHRYQLDKAQLLQEMEIVVEKACLETGQCH